MSGIIKPKNVFTFLFFSFLSFNLNAQYGPQFDNRGFEDWTTRDKSSDEPEGWHSGGTATGGLSGFLSSQIAESSQTRPGSQGTKSVRIFPKSVMGVTANGNITNGRMNAGSFSATGSGNYNYTQRSETDFSTPVSVLPDSISIWVCFRSQSATQNAQINTVIHGDADYKIVADGTETPESMHVASAMQTFQRTAPENGSFNWVRLSIPFVNNGPCTDVRYILTVITTNEVPGEGSTNDDLYVDDILLIYNPSLQMGDLSKSNYTQGEEMTIHFTLTGTMSPENLNGEPNKVIAQLSDANGSFDNPVELGRIETSESDSIQVFIPQVDNGSHYRVRVVSTNYPMIGGNEQEISISDLTNLNENDVMVSVSPNPASSEITINADSAMKDISLYDIYGRMITSRLVVSPTATLDISTLPSGIYTIQIHFNGKKCVRRVLKL